MHFVNFTSSFFWKKHESIHWSSEFKFPDQYLLKHMLPYMFFFSFSFFVFFNWFGRTFRKTKGWVRDRVVDYFLGTFRVWYSIWRSRSDDRSFRSLSHFRRRSDDFHSIWIRYGCRGARRSFCWVLLFLFGIHCFVAAQRKNSAMASVE